MEQVTCKVLQRFLIGREAYEEGDIRKKVPREKAVEWAGEGWVEIEGEEHLTKSDDGSSNKTIKVGG